MVGLLAIGLAWARPAAAVGPTGRLVVDCSGIEGWAQEPDQPEATIDVHLYFGGPAGDPAATAIAVTADRMITTGCLRQECVHGYRSALPMSLLDDAIHQVHAYGIDLTGDPNLELGDSPAPLQCPAPPIVGGERRHVVSPEILGAWQFSVFFDRLVVDDAVLAPLSEGPAIAAAPQLGIETDTGALWLIDEGFRRAVDPETVAAWRFDLATAMPLAPADLDAMPEGTPVRPRPILIQGTGPEVYLLDDHQCVPGDLDPACEEEGGSTSGDTGAASGGDSSTGGGTGGESGESGEGATTTGEVGTGDGFPGLDGGGNDDAEVGCGCRTSSPPSWGLGGGLMGLLVLRRRRRTGARGIRS